MSIDKQAEPALICQIPSGRVVLCTWQFLRGYCIQVSEPAVASLNDLTQSARVAYLNDMAMIGDALLEVTGAYRINYGILGNSDPVLHSHIVPRYLTEPDQFRRNTPWSYPREIIDSMLFDYERDKDLILKINEAIQKRL